MHKGARLRHSEDMNDPMPAPTCLSCQRQAAAINALQDENADLKARVKALEQKLSTNSTNSHRPPSTDPPNKPTSTDKNRRKRRTRKAKPRKQGAQPGHKLHKRALVPAEHLAQCHLHMPDVCKDCSAPLTGLDPDPLRHQIVELPPIKPLVIEHQLHRLTCQGCGTHTRAKLPPGVSSSGYGPRLTAFVGLLTGAYRMARRPAQQLLAEGFGVQMSLGTVVNLGYQCSQAVREPVEKARQFVKGQPVINADETGWKTGGQRRWLWVAVTRFVTVFLISTSRSKAVAQQLLGTVVEEADGARQVVYEGTVGTDRYGSYTWVGVGNRQICWAHLRRDFQKMVDADDGLVDIASSLIFEHDQIFRLWHQVRDGTLDRAGFAQRSESHRRSVKILLEMGSGRQSSLSGMCAEILKVEEALWSFVWREGVEPTNNGAEQAVRPGVQWRKASGGSQSWQGENFVARMLTVKATLRSQGRDVLGYLTEAISTARAGLPAPSLLPQSADEPSLRPSCEPADLVTVALAG